MKNIIKEVKNYYMYSKDGVRKLMANDPVRFHLTIIYLMMSITKSTDYKKRPFIFRYVDEVVPDIYKQNVKNTFLDWFDHPSKSGMCCSITKGKRLAEELSLYISKDDCLYVVYLLFRLAIFDEVNTNDRMNSELPSHNGKTDSHENLFEFIYQLSDSLQVERVELDSLINDFKCGRGYNNWYEDHFNNNEHYYPSSEEIADIFRMDMTTLSLVEKLAPNKFVSSEYINDSYFSRYISFTSISTPGVILLTFCFLMDYKCMPCTYMCIPCNIVLLLVLLALFVISYLLISSLDSRGTEKELFRLPVLRTKYENSLQIKRIIYYSFYSFINMLLTMCLLFNLLYMFGNNAFSYNYRISKTVEVLKVDTFDQSDYAYFSPVDFRNSEFKIEEEIKIPQKYQICLQTLPYLSGMKFMDIKNNQSIDNVVIYVSDPKKLILNFKMGYFGMLYYDEYKVVD